MAAMLLGNGSHAAMPRLPAWSTEGPEFRTSHTEWTSESSHCSVFQQSLHHGCTSEVVQVPDTRGVATGLRSVTATSVF